ncbi:hypothetical protein BCR32DRAFT_149416 [Anaeromyces robustus]|uniref:Uncharacterized protein n=1 Tax=Anaeromyces robustus TaxID=1754192 RepID=A0A1Y1VDE5_9FUNG|nr:hypothetical protein BCR32DRAFT_149416 [Anaeromyces robustus]|eukprot:ORX51867.1 hypothetical protein BCR32DRAFT_149416 [Anaeromyces robustus]
MLCFGFSLAYSCRSVQERYKDNMTVPSYAYGLFIILVEIINRENGLSTQIHDLFNCLGTIICTSVTIYYLYIRKFNIIYYKHKNYENEKTKKLDKKALLFYF